MADEKIVSVWPLQGIPETKMFVGRGRTRCFIGGEEILVASISMSPWIGRNVVELYIEPEAKCGRLSRSKQAMFVIDPTGRELRLDVRLRWRSGQRVRMEIVR